MVARIPKAFKDCLKENLSYIHFDTHDTTDTFAKKNVSNKKAKFIYRSLIDKIVQNPTDKFIATNSLLYNIKLKDTHLCTFCKGNDETIEHLFCDCPITYRLWQFIPNRFKLYFVNFVLNKENIFLGCKDESLLLNLLIILTKKTIFTNANSMKQSQTQLS